MKRSARKLLISVACLVLLGPALGEEPWQIDAPGRVVALADIHGAYDAFAAMLRQLSVIDASDRWTAGPTRLVIVGDVLDRGPASRAALDLIMALQPEARDQGGGVHLVLGNHEVMNLVGDLRYVSTEEFAAFAGEETPAMRDEGFAEFLARAGPEADADQARADFDRRFPAGFFAHREAFSSRGAYGAWLLDQPILLVAHDSVFVHGGLSRAFAESSGEDINHQLKRQLEDYIEAMEMLISAGVLSRLDDYYDHAARVAEYAERVAAGTASWPPDVAAAAQRVEELNTAPVFDLSSPIWYRGMAGCSPLVGQDHWERVLMQLGVERIVIGHTPTLDARVLSRANGEILRIDTGMLTSYYGGQAAALILDTGAPTVIHADESSGHAPTAQPRRVGRRPSRLTDDALAVLLAEGMISAQRLVGERPRVTIVDGGVEVEADFFPAEDGDSRPEIAAYRLDRLLGLGMVPVTVARTVDGVPGSLQFRPAGLLTETERSAQGTGGAAWCPLRDQFPAMYVFDTLVYNEGRTVEQIAYDAESFELILLGHESTFSTRRGRPAHLQEANLVLSPAWVTALSALDEERLSAELGELLSRRQLRALARRVEELVAEAGDR